MSDQSRFADIGERLHALGARPASSGRDTRWSPSVVAGVVRICDLVILATTAMLAFIARFGSVGLGGEEMIVLLLTVVVGGNAFHMAGVYRVETLVDSFTQLRKTTIAWIATILIVVLLGYLTKTSEQFSRLWAGLWFILGMLGLLASRYVLMAVLNRASARGVLAHRVAILTTPRQLPAARRIAAHIHGSAPMGIELAGMFAIGPPGNDGNAQPAGGPVDGDLRELIRRAEAQGIDKVIAVLPWTDLDDIQGTLEPLRSVSVDVDLAPPEFDGKLLGRPIRQTLGVPAVNLMTRPLSDWDVVLKRAEDYLIAVGALTLAAPLMLAIAAIIKLESPGPVFFRQPRYGFNNNLFEVYKFRTMYHHKCDLAADRLTSRGDPRVTRFGALLRRTSADELPQLFNVLKGDMSIVGPRPHAVSAKAGGKLYQDAVKTYAQRHRVRPGITGWAQVNGWRGDTDTVDKIEKRVEHDLYYIDNWSIWFDLRIVLTTAIKLMHKNAY